MSTARTRAERQVLITAQVKVPGNQNRFAEARALLRAVLPGVKSEVRLAEITHKREAAWKFLAELVRRAEVCHKT